MLQVTLTQGVWERQWHGSNGTCIERHFNTQSKKLFWKRAESATRGAI